MNQAVIEVFNKTLENTHIWLVDLMQELDWQDEHKAYLALRAVLHVLRDRITVEEAVQLGAQLPMLVRGFYYEGWHPAGKPVKERHQELFLSHVKDAFKGDERVNPERVVRAVFKVIANHVTKGEIEDIKHVLPKEFEGLWP